MSTEDQHKINGYTLSRQWFDFAFENPDKVSPIHGILYLWIVELNNRLNWKEKFGLPTAHSMDAIGVKNYRTYKKALDELEKWQFIKLIAKSKNQYTSNIISLNSAMVKNDKADNSAIVKNTKASPKQVQSTASIDKLFKQEETIIKPEPEKIPGAKIGINDLIIQEFLLIYPEYIITTPGKEKEFAGKLLSIFKKKFPGLNTDQMLTKLKEHFMRVKNVPDNWLRNNMSLTTMVNKFNPIEASFKNPGKKNNNPYASGIDKNLPSDFTKSLHDGNN